MFLLLYGLFQEKYLFTFRWDIPAVPLLPHISWPVCLLHVVALWSEDTCSSWGRPGAPSRVSSAPRLRQGKPPPSLTSVSPGPGGNVASVVRWECEGTTRTPKMAMAGKASSRWSASSVMHEGLAQEPHQTKRLVYQVSEATIFHCLAAA